MRVKTFRRSLTLTLTLTLTLSQRERGKSACGVKV